MTKSAKNTKNTQKWPKNTKNHQKWPKTQKTQKCQFWGVPRGAPRGPKKKASLSNRRIGTRNHVFYMVSIQKGHFSTPPDRACARPPKKGRIKAKLKFFFELFQKTSKIAFLTSNFAFLRPFLAFSPLLPKNAILSHFEAILTLFLKTLTIASHCVFIEFYQILVLFL